MLYLFCLFIPVTIVILEKININVSEVLRIMIAKICVYIGKNKRAKLILKDLTLKYNNSYAGHKLLAKIYEKEEKLNKAIDEYVQILEFKKNDYESYYKISVLLNKLNKIDESIEMLKKLLKSNPKMYEASKLLGKMFYDKKEFKDAIDVYNNSLQYFPQKYEMYYELGICYSYINDFKKSQICFQKVTQINNNMYLAYYRLAQIALLYRDFEEAEANFKKSLCNEKKVKSYYELAKIHMIKNKKNEAILDVNNVLNLDTSYYDIIQKEPIFIPIKKIITKPEKEKKSEFQEDIQEIEIEQYLNNTYSLIKTLRKKKKR